MVSKFDGIIHLIGVYNDIKYNIDNLAIERLGRAPQNSWEAFGAAKDIIRYADVPDGSGFRHYFSKVEMYKNGNLVGWTNGGALDWMSRPF